uniref:Uncharacterized protein n=1 Tax=Glossina pallidipes TaxID=7398 RepID=A0A1B0ABF1_GLOPL
MEALEKLTMSCLGVASCAVSDANKQGDINKQFEGNSGRVGGIYRRKDIKLTFVILNSELNKIPVGVKNVTRKYLQINLTGIYAYIVICTRTMMLKRYSLDSVPAY